MNAPIPVGLVVTDELVDALVEHVREHVHAPHPRYVTVARYAEMTGMTPRRIRTLRGHGLPSVTRAREVLIDVPAADSWLEVGQ